MAHHIVSPCGNFTWDGDSWVDNRIKSRHSRPRGSSLPTIRFSMKPDTMRTIVDIMMKITEDVNFRFMDEHVEVCVVDPSHVAMLRMVVDATAFDTWKSEGCSIGIELTKLRDLIDLADAEDLIKLAYSEGDGRVDIQVGGTNRIIRTIDNTQSVEPIIPDADPTNSFKLSTSKFSRALRAAKQVGDLVTISLNDESLSISAYGTRETVNTIIEKSELRDLECKGQTTSQYDLRYLYPLVKMIGQIDSNVTAFFDENQPLRLHFEFAGGDGRCVFFLAPRIEGEEGIKPLGSDYRI